MSKCDTSRTSIQGQFSVIITQNVLDNLFYYQQQLRQHPQKNKAIDYLKQRGLSGEIAKAFGIGYAPPGWDNLLKALGQIPEQYKLLLETGMLVEKEDHSGSYDRFRDRLMFPIRDNRGRVIGFGGRVLNDEKPKYLNSPETPVFHKQQELYGLYEARQANRHLERLLMVEGYMDVVAMAQFGITWAVATLGTSAGTTHMEKVFRHCNEVIFCFDGDEAGRKAAHRALEAVLPLMKAGRQAKFLFLPDGEDPDSLVRKIGTEKFIWHIDNAQTLSEYLFSLHAKGLDLNRTDDKARLISNIMPHIHLLPTGALQELLLRSLSEKTGLPIDDIKMLEGDLAKEAPVAPDKSPPLTTATTHYRREQLARDTRILKRTPAKTALALLIVHPELASTTDIEGLKPLATTSEDIQLLIELIEVILAKPDITTAQLIGYWQSYNKSALLRFLGLELVGDDPEQQKREYLDAIEKLSLLYQKEKQASFIEKIKNNTTLKIEDMSTEERDIYLSIFNKKTN